MAKNHVVFSSVKGMYLRLSKKRAKEVFDKGGRLFVMSSDRNPVVSLTGAHEYFIGCDSYYLGNGIKSVNTFEDMILDFCNWLAMDGYGHKPDLYRSKRCLFSYWVKICL